MQFPGQRKTPLQVVYHTTMRRPDAALALSILYGFEGKRECKVMAIAVSRNGLAAAEFCDAVGRFYGGPGPGPNSNTMLPIGLAAAGSLPPDVPVMKTVVERRTEKGELQYARSIDSVVDTSEIAALTRNALTGTGDANGVMVLGAPATELARALALPGVKQLLAAKLKMLVISDGPQDVVAAQQVLADWPTPVVLVPRELGEAVPFPGASVDTDFAWSRAHPVADAYRGFQAMPYDAPSWDMVAMMYAVHPEDELFKLSEPGTIQVTERGFEFTPGGGGKHRQLSVDPANKEKLTKKFVEIASAKPVPKQQFRRPANADAAPKPPAAVKPADGVKPAETKPSTP